MMGIARQNSLASFGNQLVDDISLPVSNLNLLFGALLLTAVGVFIGGNLLLLDLATLVSSTKIAMACLGVLLTFYAISYQTKSVIWGLVLTYGLLWLLVYSRSPFFAQVFYFLFVASGYVALRYLRVARENWSAMILMALIATLTILELATSYTSFDMLPRLHVGNVHQDTLFHASISAMIKNYGISSTALHGLVEIPYHVFSHALIAGISLISGLGVIEVYGVANSVFFAPLLIFSLTVFCGKLDQTRKLPLSLVWTLTCVLLVLLPFLFSRWAIWDSYFVSESYLVSLSLLMLGLAVLFKHHLTWIDLLCVVLIAAMIANAKASVGLIFSGLWFVRLFFINTRSLRLFVAVMSVALITGLSVYEATQANAESIPVDPFHFVRAYFFLGNHLADAGEWIQAGTLPSTSTLVLALCSVGGFFLIHFGVSWVVVGRVAFQGGLRAVFRAPLAVYSLAAVLAGAAIASIFRIDGGAAYYFSNVAFFVSLPGLVVIAVTLSIRSHFEQQRILIVGVFFVGLLGLGGFYRASLLSDTRANPHTSEMVSQLQLMRLTAPLNIVWQPTLNMVTTNPVKRCTAKPFIYPAVSERPWVDVITDGDEERCSYQAYGYVQYGISETHKMVGVAPRLMPGMQIELAQ
jgi:hypothetical protein